LGESETIASLMPHNFDNPLKIDAATGGVLAKGPVDPNQGKIYWITVWVYEVNGVAAARGSKDFSGNPATQSWDCPTTLFQDSKKFSEGPVVGVAIARVKDGGTKEYFGWWEEVDLIK